MSRFLASLIERAENRVPLLERRPRGLFEPASLKEQQLPEIAEPAVATAESVHEDSLEPAAPSPQPVPSPMATRTPEPAMRVEPLPTLRPTRAVDPSPAMSAPILEAIEPAPLPVHQTEQRREAPVRPPVETPTALLRPEPVTTVVREIMLPSQPARPIAASNQVLPKLEASVTSYVRAPAAPIEQAPLQSRPTPQSPDAARPVQSLQPRSRREPAVAALFAQAQRPTLVATSTPAATAIHISIGRVEVRANPSAAEPLRTLKPSEPRLKLDEYLRQRSRGGR